MDNNRLGEIRNLREQPTARAIPAEYDYQPSAAALEVDTARVLRNTYMLLGMTVAFSALIAWFSMDAPRPHFLIVLAGFYGLLFGIHKTQNSSMSLVLTFALTGFMGYTLGPIIGMFAGAGAMHIVANALTLTALTFVGLSAVVLVTRKDFSFLGSFLMVGALVLIGAMLIGLFFDIAGLHLMISAGFTLFASAAILYETSAIIHGGQRNYVLAAVGLYVSIYNLFLSLLSLLGAFSGDD
ncbi:MAG: Bax inhibitor-1/YccA family protein [Gammaproteobacteria bacterium]|nr:Bax inhibitor-1/YccA family protein [Gammaproteobacteria bacterium]